MRRSYCNYCNISSEHLTCTVSGGVYGPRGLEADIMKAKRKKASGKSRKTEDFAAGVLRGLRLAAKDARKIARMYGTPLYYWENGKVVAKKP